MTYETRNEYLERLVQLLRYQDNAVTYTAVTAIREEIRSVVKTNSPNHGDLTDAATRRFRSLRKTKNYGTS